MSRHRGCDNAHSWVHRFMYVEICPHIRLTRDRARTSNMPHDVQIPESVLGSPFNVSPWRSINLTIYTLVRVSGTNLAFVTDKPLFLPMRKRIYSNNLLANDTNSICRTAACPPSAVGEGEETLGSVGIHPPDDSEKTQI